MKKLAYPVISLLLFVFLIGCGSIEMKKISIVKCRSCGKILEGPDTTIVRGHYNRDKGILTTSEGRMYHLGYYGKVIENVNTVVCEECKKKQKLAIIKEKEEYRELRRQLANYKPVYIKTNTKREREKKKQELADRFVECGIRFAIISDVYREMNYNLKHYTLSSQIQLKARELEKYAEDVYLPAANEFSYYLSRYGEKYGAVAVRDLAIQYGFIHCLTGY